MSIDALAKHVRTRRHELGMTLLEMSSKGGPSHMTILNIENGKRAKYRADTLLKLDTALDWPVGSAVQLLENDTPPAEVPIETALATREDARALRIGQMILALMEELRLT